MHLNSSHIAWGRTAHRYLSLGRWLNARFWMWTRLRVFWIELWHKLLHEKSQTSDTFLWKELAVPGCYNYDKQLNIEYIYYMIRESLSLFEWFLTSRRHSEGCWRLLSLWFPLICSERVLWIQKQEQMNKVRGKMCPKARRKYRLNMNSFWLWHINLDRWSLNCVQYVHFCTF